MKKAILLLIMFIASIINAQDKIYVHTATVENIFYEATYIDHPDLNENPNAGIVFSHVWNPNGNTGVHNDNIDSLWYDDSDSRWYIFNEDASSMLEGTQFFIYIAADPASVITHISTAANQGSAGSYTTEIDDPNFNGLDPGPFAIISTYFNPNSVSNLHLYSFFYDEATNRRVVYNREGTAIPEGAAFKILVNGDEGVTPFTHVTDVTNNFGHRTTLDHPDLNGNPNATFVFSHYWGMNYLEAEP